jgi:hypothetical protein
LAIYDTSSIREPPTKCPRQSELAHSTLTGHPDRLTLQDKSCQMSWQIWSQQLVMMTTTSPTSDVSSVMNWARTVYSYIYNYIYVSVCLFLLYSIYNTSFINIHTCTCICYNSRTCTYILLSVITKWYQYRMKWYAGYMYIHTIKNNISKKYYT